MPVTKSNSKKKSDKAIMSKDMPSYHLTMDPKEHEQLMGNLKKKKTNKKK